MDALCSDHSRMLYLAGPYQRVLKVMRESFTSIDPSFSEAIAVIYTANERSISFGPNHSMWISSRTLFPIPKDVVISL